MKTTKKQNLMNKKILLIICSLPSFLFSQNNLVIDSLNIIQNKEVLSGFYNSLTNDSITRIVHIGDSHIQANFLTGRLREQIQNKYKNAGRGLVFPLRLAETNGHLDTRFSSDIQWERNRIIDENNTDIGIAGVSISTNNPNFYIKMYNKEEKSFSSVKIIGKGLKKLKIAIAKNDYKPINTAFKSKYYTVKSGDVLGKIARKFGTNVKRLKSWNKLKSDRINIGQKLVVKTRKKTKPIKFNDNNFKWLTPSKISDTQISINFNEPTTSFYIVNDTVNNTKTTIYSVFMQNNKTGVIYHSTGVNGAKYGDYNNSDLFFEQVSTIKPHLIIVSLGTNEAFDKNYSEERMKAEINTFFEKLKASTLCNSILITTPPASLYKRRYTPKKLEPFVQIIKKFCLQNNYSLWDLNEIMGEKGIENWYKKGFVARDKIHYTKKGYELQADMLYEALFKK